ncbi:hypothetical protein AHAS_Ahas20G0117400 [Arachis hypogaea]
MLCTFIYTSFRTNFMVQISALTSHKLNNLGLTSQNQYTGLVVGITSPRIIRNIISTETMATASSTTASRLLKFVPTLDFRPPKKL